MISTVNSLTNYGWTASWDTGTVPNGTHTLQSVASSGVILPSNGATVSATEGLDASASAGVTQVRYELTGGSLNHSVIATATATIYGWTAVGSPRTLQNGNDVLQSVAFYAGGPPKRRATLRGPEIRTSDSTWARSP